jgi:hypothetical protein
MVERLTIDGASFETIPVDELKYNFALIENDLFKIKQKSFTDWNVADVYTSLQNNISKLHIIYSEDKYGGFLITQVISHELTGETILHVWATYSKSEYNYKKAGFLFLDQLAEKLDVDAIEFVTSRAGWSQIAPMYGFDLLTYTYRKDL